MIEASQRMITIKSQGELGGINPVIKKHYELQIKTLQNAPRDADNLRRLLKVKQRQKKEAEHIEDTQGLVTEIEMLRVVLYCIWRWAEVKMIYACRLSLPFLCPT
jgi:demethoxyubiquinone hydroxylase (CLK1/Coq7/Cat5 family)